MLRPDNRIINEVYLYLEEEAGTKQICQTTLACPVGGNRRRIGDRTFSVAATRAWNRLPTELKLLRSTELFRRDLKTFLFHSVYGHQDTD